LSNEGYEIQAVSDGNDAIQQVSLFRPDVVLIDVSLPGKSAFEVKRAINEMDDLEEVRFVLMSSAFEKVDEPQAEQVKFHGRLTKPFDPAHLRQVLGDVLAQVTAKRLEPTAMIQRPNFTTPPAATPPTPSAPVAPPATPPIEELASPESLHIQIEEPEGIPPESAQAPVREMPSLPGFTMPTQAPARASAPPKPAPPSPPPASTISLTPPDETELNLDHHPDSGPSLHFDNFEEPIQPEDSPALSPPAVEAIGELWDHGAPDLSAALGGAAAPAAPRAEAKVPQRAAPSPQPPAPSVTPSSSRSDDDIRQLTESTIRMSGLDDFQWSVKEPSLKPSANQMDIGSNNFQIEAPSDFPSEMPAFNPDRAETPGGPSIDFDMPSAPPQKSQPASSYYNAPDDESTQRIQPPPPPAGRIPGAPANGGAAHDVIPVSAAEMEEMIRRQVEETLGKLAQKILPEVAERVIKQEIHRLLSEQP
jgi:CheY-like chemotaxis protein